MIENVAANSKMIQLDIEDEEETAKIHLYKIDDGELRLVRTMPAAMTSFEVTEAGQYAVVPANKANVKGEMTFFRAD